MTINLTTTTQSSTSSSIIIIQHQHHNINLISTTSSRTITPLNYQDVQNIQHGFQHGCHTFSSTTISQFCKLSTRSKYSTSLTSSHQHQHHHHETTLTLCISRLQLEMIMHVLLVAMLEAMFGD